MVVHNCLHDTYRVQIVQALKPDDELRRIKFAKNILPNSEANENYLRRWIFSDDSALYISGRVYHYKCRMWESGYPHATQKIDRASAEVNVALSSSELLE
jgi:hypothetical protein